MDFDDLDEEARKKFAEAVAGSGVVGEDGCCGGARAHCDRKLPTELSVCDRCACVGGGGVVNEW